MTGGADRWALLLSTFLHDIPWKPWIVARRLTRWEGLEAKVTRECRNYARIVNARKRNDREAQALIAWIACRLAEKGAREAAEKLVEVAEREWERAVSEADTIASSIDRLLSPLPREVSGVNFVNMFNPVFIFGNYLDVLSAANIDELLKKVLEFIEYVVDLVLKVCNKDDSDCVLKKLYMTLYTLLEVAWYRATEKQVGLPVPPPADTRVPHHTIFDHGRAAATALALRGKTVYALIDIPGVQSFISAARKTRDFWAGSWILSTVMWGIVRSIVEEEGPQAILLPAMHLNPFYLDMLASAVNGIEKLYPDIAWKALGGWPSQPVMPATISVILDGERWSCRKLQERVLKNLVDTWRRLWEKIRPVLEKFEERLKSRGLDEACVYAEAECDERSNPGCYLARLLCRHALTAAEGDLKEAENVLKVLVEYVRSAMENPPFEARVTCIEVDFEDSEYKKFVGRIEGELEKLKVRGEDGEKTLAQLAEEMLHKYETTLKKSLDRMLRLTYLRLRLDKEEARTRLTSPSYTLQVYNKLHSLWEAARTTKHATRFYRYCSVCGRLPAAVRYPRIGDPIYYYNVGSRKVEKKTLGNDITLNEALRHVGYLLDEGEALCPYCLLRRLLARYPWIAENLVESVRRIKRGRLESTLDIANSWLREEIVEKLVEAIPRETWKELIGEEVEKEYADPRKYAEVLLDRLGLEGVLDILHAHGKTISVYRRIAAIYGDGDMMGKGYLRGIIITGESSIEKLLTIVEKMGYLANLYSRLQGPEDLRRYALPAIIYYSSLFRSAKLDKRYSRDVERAVLLLAGLAAAVTSVLRSEKVLDNETWPLTIVPSLSYLRTLSTSIMISALVDALIVNALRGVLVYAGGDDVLAILPCLAPPHVNPLNEVRNRLEEYGGMLDVPATLLPVSSRSSELGSSIAWLSVALTRLNYWGMLGNRKGFHVYRGVVAQAPVAHGRSYGVNIVHHRSPLWSVLSDTHRLMDEKDKVVVAYLSGEDSPRGIRKDVTIVGFEGGAEAFVPITLYTLRERVESLSTHNLNVYMLKGLELVSRMYSRLDAGIYTRSLVYDALEEVNARITSELALRGKQDALTNYTLYLISRNRVGSIDDEDKRLATELARYAVEKSEGHEGLRESLATCVFTAVRHLAACARRG